MRIMPKPSEVMPLVVSQDVFRQRLRLGWSRYHAATLPKGTRLRKRQASVSDIARRHGIARTAIACWLRRHPDQRHLSYEEVARIVAGNKRGEP